MPKSKSDVYLVSSKSVDNGKTDFDNPGFTTTKQEKNADAPRVEYR